jgi:phosphoglycerate dehydrogenase-like enzyme
MKLNLIKRIASNPLRFSIMFQSQWIKNKVKVDMESSTDKFKVVFGGLGHFEAAFLKTREALKDDQRISVVQSAAESIESAISDADVVIPFMVPMTERLLQFAPKLKMIMQYGVGIEGVDVKAASTNKVWVCSIPSKDCSNDKSTAEQAVYLALSVCRDQKAMHHSLMTGRIGFPCGKSLFGSKALIYGFGGIGQQLAKRLSSFDMHISAVTRTLPRVNETFPSQEYLTELSSTTDFPRFASEADIVFICCSQNSGNRGLVDKTFLSCLKDGTIIINVARGGLLNYDDVLDALNSGKLSGVGIDVYHTEPFPSPLEDPFLSHPRVVATPHVGGVTQISYDNMAALVAANVRKIIAGLDPVGAVNTFDKYAPVGE